MKNVFFAVTFTLTGAFTFANNAKVVSSAKLDKIENIENLEVILDNCGHAGDAVYDHARSQGATHRQARRIRRAFVRNCRRQER